MRNNPSYTQPGTLGAIDALSDILSGVKRDVARSREVLNGAFGKIAARFAQVHAIAVAAEARDSGISDEALQALRTVTDGLTIELQFEDALSQLLDHVQGKVEAIGVALSETRTLVSSAPAGEAEPVGPALEVLARTVKSIQTAAEAAVADRSTASGTVELF
jgi:hypothetical protein